MEPLSLSDIKMLIGDQAIFIAQLQKAIVKLQTRIAELEKKQDA